MEHHKSKKVAIVHDYLYQYGGAEKVVETWLEMYPEATVYTCCANPSKFTTKPFKKAFNEGRVITSPWQFLFTLSFFQVYFKHLFPVYPFAMKALTVDGYDIVLISSTYCGKSIRLGENKKVIHYCHTPMRYLHRGGDSLLPEKKSIVSPILNTAVRTMRGVDIQDAHTLSDKGVTWVANSEFIAKKIATIYNERSQVIYPPVEIEKFSQIQRVPDNTHPYYFYFGRVSFHKRIDLIIDACIRTQKKVVIGGKTTVESEEKILQNKIAEFEKNHPDKQGWIQFKNERMDDDEVAEHLSKCQAFIFPAKEDFGITPVEVLASGTPIIAFGKAGVLEYVVDGENGVLFPKQTVESLIDAIATFEITKKTLQPKYTALQKFSKKAFIANIQDLVS